MTWEVELNWTVSLWKSNLKVQHRSLHSNATGSQVSQKRINPTFILFILCGRVQVHMTEKEIPFGQGRNNLAFVGNGVYGFVVMKREIGIWFFIPILEVVEGLVLIFFLYYLVPENACIPIALLEVMTLILIRSVPPGCVDRIVFHDREQDWIRRIVHVEFAASSFLVGCMAYSFINGHNRAMLPSVFEWWGGSMAGMNCMRLLRRRIFHSGPCHPDRQRKFLRYREFPFDVPRKSTCRTKF